MSDMLRIVTQSPWGRWIALALWLWLGWHLFIRGWGFFLRDLPGAPPATSWDQRPAGMGAADVTVSHLLRDDVLPLAALYALIVAMLVGAARRLSAQPPKGQADINSGAVPPWPRVAGFVASTLITGYVAFLIGAALYYLLVANQPASFLLQALWGGAFLAFGLALPCYLAACRLGTRRLRFHRGGLAANIEHDACGRDLDLK